MAHTVFTTRPYKIPSHTWPTDAPKSVPRLWHCSTPLPLPPQHCAFPAIPLSLRKYPNRPTHQYTCPEAPIPQMSAPAPRESSEVHLRGHRTFGGGKGTLGNGEGGGEDGNGRGGLNMGAGVRQITGIQAAVMAREAVAAPCHPSLGLLCPLTRPPGALESKHRSTPVLFRPSLYLIPFPSI